MRRLSWNVRVVLGLIILVIIAAVVFVIYYNVTRTRLDKPMEVNKYPDAQLVFEEKLLDGSDRLYYEIDSDDVGGVDGLAQRVEKFYRDEEYTCRALYDNSVYVYSTCLLEKTNFLGFDRFNRIMIVPLRDENNNLTGDVGIDVRRSWGSNGGIGN